jgi:hypothetical protein
MIDGTRREPQNRLTITFDKLSSIVAHYTVKEETPRRSANRMAVSLGVAVRDVCVAGLSHELTVTSEVTGGQRPIAARAEISYPDKTGESSEIKPIASGRQLPVNFPRGGSVTIRVTATDAGKATAYSEKVTPLTPCR